MEPLLLGVEQHAVFRLVIDLDLRMVGPHVTLAARLRRPRQRDRRRMPRMAGGAGADRAVGIRPADVVTLHAALRDRRRALALGQCVGDAIHRAGVKLLRRGDLLRREVAGPAHRRPGRGRVAAAQELVVLRLMALGAIGRRQMLGDHESAMIERLLPLRPADGIRDKSRLGGHARSSRTDERPPTSPADGTRHTCRPTGRAQRVGCQRSAIGRRLLTTNAATTSAAEITTAANTARKDITFDPRPPILDHGMQKRSVDLIRKSRCDSSLPPRRLPSACRASFSGTGPGVGREGTLANPRNSCGTDMPLRPEPRLFAGLRRLTVRVHCQAILTDSPDALSRVGVRSFARPGDSPLCFGSAWGDATPRDAAVSGRRESSMHTIW